MFKKAFLSFWTRLRTRCGEGCSSGGVGIREESDIITHNLSSASCRHPHPEMYPCDRRGKVALVDLFLTVNGFKQVPEEVEAVTPVSAQRNMILNCFQGELVDPVDILRSYTTSAATAI